jgi:hypothetical protein
MPYIATNARSYEKQSVGDGQCVAFVRAASKAPHNSVWKKGKPVKTSNALSPGTAIATFDQNGTYGSRKDGTSHAAIFMRKTATGIVVLDQWVTNGKNQLVHERTIRFDNSIGKKINNGDEYYVIE